MISISVIVPAYNAAQTIGTAIGSLLRQNYPHWEAIVIDDGSQDDTAVVTRELCKKDRRILLLSQPNQGVSAARNAGIGKAQHEWLLFLDADDWISDDFFEAFSNAAAASPDIDAFHCGWTRVASDGSLMLEKRAPDHEDLFPVLAKSCAFAIHSCVFKKSLLNDSGVFDTSLTTCEDWDLWQRIARTGATFKFVEKALAYYRLRRGSLSRDVERCYRDVLFVLGRAQVADPRVVRSSRKYFDGIKVENLPLAKVLLRCWFIAQLIGERKDFRSALQGNDMAAVCFVEANDVADILFEACILPSNLPLSQWPLLWQDIGDEIKDFLYVLESLTRCRGLARKSLLRLGRTIIRHAVNLDKIEIDPFYVVQIEITQPIEDVCLTGNMERLYATIQFEGKVLGGIELPIWEHQVLSWQVKHAIAKKYYWEILGLYYRRYVYDDTDGICLEEEPKGFVDTHQRRGWIRFLRDIWNKPDWSVDQFYNPHHHDDSDQQGVAGTGGSGVEVTGNLAGFGFFSGKMLLPVKVGGVLVGGITITKVKGCSAQQIRALVNTELGLHLCEVSVREALIGTAWDEPKTLRQRLTELLECEKPGLLEDFPIEGPALVATLTDKVVMKRKTGSGHSFKLEQSAVPKELMATFKKMPATLERVGSAKHYQEKIKVGGKDKNSVGSLYDRKHFETLFSTEPDPWGYTHAYEQTKYEQTLSLLPKKVINHSMEIACAEGHFTLQLAPRVAHLLAVDISRVALKRAAERCSEFTNIEFQPLDILKDAIVSKYDLIVCSEVLYYVGNLHKLKDVASKLSEALHPGGHLLTAHAHQIVDEPKKPGFDWGLPFGAKVIGETIVRTGSLRLEKEIRTPLYRIQLFEKSHKTLFSRFWPKKPEILIIDQPTPVPANVESTVRWSGGKPKLLLDECQRRSDKLPVLMYHRVAPEGKECLNRFRITPEDFEDQLKYLQDSGFYSVRWEDWSRAIALKKSLPGRPIALTFDDGYLDFHQYAWPLLKKYGFTATVFLVSNQVGATNIWDDRHGEECPLMNWQQIRELDKEGVLFGSHSCTHTALTALPPPKIYEEGVNSRICLSENLNYAVDLFAYPYGDTDELTADLISNCGYQFGFTCRPGFSEFKTNPMLLPRIEVKGSDTIQDFVNKVGL